MRHARTSKSAILKDSAANLVAVGLHPQRQGSRIPRYVAPIRDTDTPIWIRRHGDTASSKNKDTPIRRVYIEAEK